MKKLKMFTMAMFVALSVMITFNSCDDSSVIPGIESEKQETNTEEVSTRSNWSLIRHDKGVALYEKGGIYVQAINLSKGADLRLVQGNAINNPSNQNSPLFQRKSLRKLWDDEHQSSSFSITNCQFFHYNNVPVSSAYAELSLPIKDNGIVISTGSNNSQNARRKFGINGSQSWVDNYTYNGTNLGSVQQNLLSPTAIVGFSPYVDMNAWVWFVNRTMIGVSDPNGDGANEMVYIVTGTGTQSKIRSVLNEWGCSNNNIVMLDGSGSTQMICKHVNYFASNDNRTIPSAMIVERGHSW